MKLLVMFWCDNILHFDTWMDKNWTIFCHLGDSTSTKVKMHYAPQASVLLVLLGLHRLSDLLLQYLYM